MAGSGFDRLGARLAACLAAAALALPIALPPGFMPARTDGGPAIVICTGHGPWPARLDDHGRPAKPPARNQGGVCVFACHGGVAPAPAAPAAVALTAVVNAAEPSIEARDLQPGRGLAAPPPPSQGPPSAPV